MADVISNPGSKAKGVKRMIKKSTRVDLTPMVDLGFILVTFFVFTTTLSLPQGLNIMVPKETAHVNDKICESCALTILLGPGDRVWYYEGSDANAQYKETSYSPQGLRKIIRDKKEGLIRSTGENKITLMIKSADRSTMKNMVNVVDESVINKVARYYMVELSDADKNFLKAK